MNASANPLGIDDAKPTFSWIITTAARAIHQKQYQIVVASTAAKAAKGQGDVWDSGEVVSDATSVDYSGPDLNSRTRYYWSVRTWTPGASSWAKPASFETAYLSADEWRGDWITGPARPIAPLTGTAGTDDDAGLVPSTTLSVGAPAGATNLKVNSVGGATVGSQVRVGLGDVSQLVEITAVGTASMTTTTVTPTSAGGTRLYVASVNGIAVGDILTVGSATATVTDVGTAAGQNRSLSAAAAAGDTVIKVNNTGGFVVGQGAVVGTGSSAVVRTVTAVGTSGATGTGITLDAPLGADFASGTAARGTGTGLGVSGLSADVIGGASVVNPGSGLTISPALTESFGVGTTVVLADAEDICRPVGNSSNSGQCKPIRPNFLLRTTFDVAPKSEHGAVTSARLYSVGLGWNEPSVNGQLAQPGEHLNPGFTDYKDTVQYTTDDVTALIQQHATEATENVLASEIAAGRYDSESIPSNHRFEFAQWRNQEPLKADLWVTYADGTEEVVSSGDDWKVSIDGPTRYADFDNGETYDARHVISGWNTASYDDSGWLDASPGVAPEGEVIAQLHERTKETEKLEGPFYEWSPAEGVKAVDVGRQIAGWATIKVWGAEPGQVIRTVYVERRNDDTTIDDPNVPGTGQDGALQFAGNLQQSYYVSDGTGTEENPETFTPNWNFAGFQWVQIDGTNGAPLPENVHVEVASAQQIMTGLDEVGTFESNDTLLNQIHTNVKNTVKGNWIAGYSSDTPTYEKDGWTGDAQIILPTVANLFDIQQSMVKSARDSKDSQLDDGSGQTGLLIPGSEGYGYCSKNAQGTYVPCGSSPSIATFKGSGAGATPIWDAFIVVTSYEAWQRYADVRPMTTAFGTIESYLDDWIQGGVPYGDGPGGWFVRDGSNDWTLNSGLGDWAFVTGANGNAEEGTNLNVGGFQAASSTAFTAYLAKLTAEMADVLFEKTGDEKYQAAASKYRTLFDNIREDFNERWWDADRGFYAENATQELRQGFQAWAIGFGLVEEEDKLALMEKLAYDVAVTRTGHAMTGFVGIRWIWPVLSDAAHLGVPHAKEALFKVAQQTTYPSYGYHIGLGYTGIGEYWENTTRTRNHQFQGSIGQWFYEELAGIKPASPGYEEITIRPLVGAEYGVTDVSASVDTVHGKISSSWVDGGADGKLTLKVTVPANTTAKIHVPGTDASKIVESGSGTALLASKAAGVKLIGQVDDAIVYEVGSGTYEFTRQP
ncbi:family 78 glycoside hydrolase catalytic domain [Agromyces sp. NPDC056523]|uniref:family 78 glycoside hydrolase catalytic domain n=1 Tax=Agromyces sp. NPDC056523 TaxID=3345850 RepID=UPI003672C571